MARELILQHGNLTSTLINQHDELPRAGYFIRRFGNLVSVCRMLGFKPRIRYSHAPLTRRLVASMNELVASLIRQAGQVGMAAIWQKRKRLLHLNGELQVGIYFIRSSLSNFGTLRWVVRLRSDVKPDIIILVRMDASNQAVRDYYVLPRLDLSWTDIQLGENNGFYFDTYRCPSLDFFIGRVAHTKFPNIYE